jgi:hypothetical protein
MRAAVALALAVLPLSVPSGAGVVRASDLLVPRAAHSASLLPSGQVLVAGGCAIDGCETDGRASSSELFDPASRMFRRGPRLVHARVGHTATRLRDGRVLLAGGWSGDSPTATAELYDPAWGRFIATGAMAAPRGGHTATLLADGRVLVVGGTSPADHELRLAELYDPGTGRWRGAGALRTPRAAHASVRLPENRVLVTGGSAGGRVLASTEVWTPRGLRFRAGPRLRTRRHKHEAVVLRTGAVLVVGGSDERDFRGRHATAELLPRSGTRFVRVQRLKEPRFKLAGAVVALPSGGALVAGGGRRAELYEPQARRFARVPGELQGPLSFATATLLRDGRVLVTGGYDDRIAVSPRAWLVETG